MTKSGRSGAGKAGPTPEPASERPAGKTDRKARLAEELRANLQRRKAQARSRRTGGADERPEGIGAARPGGANGKAPSGQERGG
jgi:hypothetical protein